MKMQADKKQKEGNTFKIDDTVYLSTKYIKLKLQSRKLGPKYIGPFTIEQIINPVTVKLKLPTWLGRIHPVFHTSLLKVVKNNHTESSKKLNEQNQNHIEINKILNSRIRLILQYLVRWKGYPEIEASWVKATDVQID
uniref:Chromo domain-containing protein n=1 Tax=Micrurus paraensis TaxID=1970185 RepID=A0A2D4K4N5_9SAUR